MTLEGVMQGENVWCDSIVSTQSRSVLASMPISTLPYPSASSSQIDALHGSGYSMLVAEDVDHLGRLWHQYHKQTKVILWNDGPFGRDGGTCMNDPKCTHRDPNVPLSPPNATHYNIPLWCAWPSTYAVVC